MRIFKGFIQLCYWVLSRRRHRNFDALIASPPADVFCGFGLTAQQLATWDGDGMRCLKINLFGGEDFKIDGLSASKLTDRHVGDQPLGWRMEIRTVPHASPVGIHFWVAQPSWSANPGVGAGIFL